MIMNQQILLEDLTGMSLYLSLTFFIYKSKGFGVILLQIVVVNPGTHL